MNYIFALELQTSNLVFLFHIKYSIKIFSRTKVACDLFRGLSLYRNSSKSTRRFSCYGHRYCLVSIRFQASFFFFQFGTKRHPYSAEHSSKRIGRSLNTLINPTSTAEGKIKII